jgi:two-component system cell cycle sensor histidine kinase/response regulator CckA
MATRILIVEDSRTQAEALRILLETQGYSIAVAPDGETAVKRIREEAFDLVVSDITMPGFSGFELCKRIKGPLNRHDLPVLLLTALSDPMDIVMGLEAGADNYVTKPYQPDQLTARIAHMLKNRELRRTAPSRLGVNVTFLGSTFTVNSEKEQILDLLVATFEDAVLQNRQLRQREAELEAAKAQLARYAGKLEEQLHSVLNSVPDVVFSLRPDGHGLHYVSPAATTVLGLTPEALAADLRRWTNAIHPDDRQAASARFALAVETGRPDMIEYRLIHPDESLRWIEVTFSPVRGDRGRVSRVDGVARDITERKRLEEQLRLSQKMDAVGTLAGGVAHDFNNLLAAIRGTADLALMEMDATNPLHSEMVQIRDTVDRGAALTRQLLAFGRRQVLEPQPVDATGLTAGVLGMLDRVLGKDIRISSHLSTDPCVVMADPGQLEQVLMNLCVNARDAMPNGGELVILTDRVVLDHAFCEAHPWAREGDYVRLTVSDTGIGMDAETQARIFEPFFTTKEMGRGSGLGLAVVYGIVKQHQGLIHVYSEPGKGTTFRIYFLFSSEHAQPAARPSREKLNTGSEALLLAEDDAALRATTARLLGRLGYQVQVASSGREALAMLNDSAGHFDMAILDVVMPEMGGQAVFEEVRSRHPDMRFLFITGYSPETSHLAPLRSTATRVLQKPFAVEALALAVRETLDK